jgi:hypothetical protein
VGELGAAKEKLRGLRVERERLAGELAHARTDFFTVEELMPRLLERIRDLEGTFRADIARGRMALGSLFGEHRLRVYRDGRIEGDAILHPETLRAARRTPRPSDSVVAGGRYARACIPVPLVLPVMGQVVPRAA